MPPRDYNIVAIQDYYGKIIHSSKDLQTNTCCCADSIPLSHLSILDNIDNEILEKFYGCGSPISSALDGCTILDLGCGSGRDVYLTSALVGPRGFVIGVDMTEEPLILARAHQQSQAKRFGFPKSNVEFRRGYIEDLGALDIADNSIDVVISNCVINLSPAKDRVFAEIFRVLKPGGELFFSDVFASRRLPPALREDRLLVGECLGGATYIEDFRRMLRGLGCPDYRVMTKSRISIDNPEAEAKVGATTFWSMKIRAFKIGSLEDLCEDYGQVATYLGTIPDHPHQFPLDDHHTFITGKPMLVCGNTASMVGETRFAPHFRVDGDRSVHFGPFDCSSPVATTDGRGCC
ncbi:MAG TPA: methyltransferase domain-containing protein [Telmatospirillum sp.]|nr:methyltransferase domain-containing protein [Telmatospirillum sp.]